MYYVYRSTPTRLYLIGTFSNMKTAHDFAQIESLDNPEVFAVVIGDGTCVGKYQNGKYYI